MNPTIIAVALGIWIATGLGSWFYRGHIDAGEVKDAQDKIVALSSLASEASQKAAADATRVAQQVADERAAAFQLTMDDQRSTYEKKLAASNAALRHLPSCPVPLSAISLLLDPQSPSGSGPAPRPGPVPGGTSSGTVDASVVISNCEFNRGAFERNRERLNQCITSFDAARAEVNTTK